MKRNVIDNDAKDFMRDIFIRDRLKGKSLYSKDVSILRGEEETVVDILSFEYNHIDSICSMTGPAVIEHGDVKSYYFVTDSREIPYDSLRGQFSSDSFYFCGDRDYLIMDVDTYNVWHDLLSDGKIHRCDYGVAIIMEHDSSKYSTAITPFLFDERRKTGEKIDITKDPSKYSVYFAEAANFSVRDKSVSEMLFYMLRERCF